MDPNCLKCSDSGVIESGNNDFPCDCQAGDRAVFNVAGVGQIAGKYLKNPPTSVPDYGMSCVLEPTARVKIPTTRTVPKSSMIGTWQQERIIIKNLLDRVRKTLDDIDKRFDNAPPGTLLQDFFILKHDFKVLEDLERTAQRIYQEGH